MAIKKTNRVLTYFFTLIMLIGLLFSTGYEQALALETNVNAPCNVILSPASEVSKITVTWWDNSAISEGKVKFSLSNTMENASIAEATINHSDTKNGFSSFEATMTGLEAGKDYYYQVGNDVTGWSNQYKFSIKGGGTKDFSFLYMGDVQYNSQETAAEEYAAWGELLSQSATKFPEVSFGLLGGDMVNYGQNYSDWNMFLGEATKIFSKIPLLSTPGNHESNAVSGKPELYLKFFSLPKNGPENFKEEFYSYDYNDCHVVALNSNIFLNEQLISGAMKEADFDKIKQWIKDDLASSNAKWKIIVMHHPAYQVVSDAAAQKVMENWVPVFEEAQVDLALCGHQHVYMRTAPMYHNKMNNKGITYVMGNSGKKFYNPVEVFYSRKMLDHTSTYQIVKVTDDNLSLSTYGLEGSLLDSVTMTVKDRTQTIEDELLGDINGDGKVTMDDAQAVIAAIVVCNYSNKAMDVNGDGLINICDAHKIALLCQN